MYGVFCRKHCSREAQSSCISFCSSFLRSAVLKGGMCNYLHLLIQMLVWSWFPSDVALPLCTSCAAGDGCAASGVPLPYHCWSLVGDLLLAGGKGSPLDWPQLSRCIPLLVCNSPELTRAPLLLLLYHTRMAAVV